MEETETSTHHTTKVSDSGYSLSCSNSNSQSQRSEGSSKLRHSASSSGSSGYCGHQSNLGSSNDSFQRPSTTKRKEYKKTLVESMNVDDQANENSGKGPAVAVSGTEASSSGPTSNEPASAIASVATTAHSILDNAFSSSGISQEKENIQQTSIAHNLLPSKKHKGNDICSDDEMMGSTKRLTNERAVNIDELHVSIDNKTLHPKEEFSAVVSMEEGVILYSSNTLTQVLGYPNGMWLGRSFIDFVHSKDRKAFNSHITSVISSPVLNRRDKNLHDSPSAARYTVYCCLRQYRGLKSSGFGIVDKKVSYLPCQLTFSFRTISTKPPTVDNDDMNNKSTAQLDSNIIQSVLLVIAARKIQSFYTVPDEMCAFATCMVTRHSASMEFTHADPEVVKYLGFLPQDIIGQSVFDYYHPNDLSYLRDVYTTVFKDKGQPFRSKPYRLRTQNGGYCLVETEWSSFINPWTKKIEFVTGQHHVIQGPLNPDVITLVDEKELHNEDTTIEHEALKNEILNLLNEKAEPDDSSKWQLTKYCKKIQTMMETNVPEDKTDISESKPVSLSFSERDSVMLGEISPHHEYYDSKSSSETPPSYTQLNYDDNLQRFFESKPKTTLSDKSGDSKTCCRDDKEDKATLRLEGDVENDKQFAGNSFSAVSQNRYNKCGGNSDLNSRGGANEKNNETTSITNNKTSNNSNNCLSDNGNLESKSQYRSPHLTEELLFRHNENMEKKMVQRHKEKSKSDRELKIKDGRQKKNNEKITDEQNNHGVKRSVSQDWEDEPSKCIKQTHDVMETANTNGNNNIMNNISNNDNSSGINVINEYGAGKTFSCIPSISTTLAPTVPQPNHLKKIVMNSTPNSMNLWPPFSLSVTPLHSTQPCNTQTNYPGTSLSANSVMPMYYVPTPDFPSSSRTNTYSASLNTSLSASYMQPQTPYVASQFQYLPSHPLMYQAVSTPMPVFGLAPLPSPTPAPVASAVMYSSLLTSVGVTTTPLLAAANNVHHSTASLRINTSDNATETSSQMMNMNGGAESRLSALQGYGQPSISATPGSAAFGLTSNSLHNVNAMMSETSNINQDSSSNSMSQSMESTDSSGSPQEDVKPYDNSNDMMEAAFLNDNSSYYSSVHSFTKVDEKSDESMKSSTENDSSVDTNNEHKEEKSSYCVLKKRKNNAADIVQHKIRQVSPWLEKVSLTPDFIYRYQVTEKELPDVLEADRKLLSANNQPTSVNDQLSQLYFDLENYHLDNNLEASIGISSSSGSSSDEADDYQIATVKKKYRSMQDDDRLVMVYEENAPLPSPIAPSIATATLS